jgi:hypothetical protein
MMNNNWQQLLKELQQYIQNNSEIRIERHSISIPENLRPEFYGLFRQIQVELVKDRYPSLLSEARLLSLNYIEIESKISRAKYNPDKKNTGTPKKAAKKNASCLWRKMLGRFNPGSFKLDGILLEANLDEFLHVPLDAFTRVLFDPLFDLIQGKSDINELERIADEKINTVFDKLYKQGYARWLILNLIKLLESDALFNVVSDEISPKAVMKQEVNAKEARSQLSSPEKTSVLAFNHGRNMHTFSNVDILDHSNNLKKYIGFKTKYETAAHEVAVNLTQRPSLPYETVKNVLKEGPILIYAGDQAQDASLVADKKQFWCPDMIIDIKETTNGNAADTISYSALKPTFGTVLIRFRHLPKTCG